MRRIPIVWDLQKGLVKFLSETRKYLGEGTYPSRKEFRQGQIVLFGEAEIILSLVKIDKREK